MSPTLILVLGLLPVAVFVMWPLFAGDTAQASETVPEDPTATFDRQKIAAYAAIKEAEFDRRTGKLSDDDYENQVARYKQQALEAIASLEKEGMVRRRGPVSGPPPTIRFCPSCGTERAPAAKFCANCGTSLTAV